MSQIEIKECPCCGSLFQSEGTYCGSKCLEEELPFKPAEKVECNFCGDMFDAKYTYNISTNEIKLRICFDCNLEHDIV